MGYYCFTWGSLGHLVLNFNINININIEFDYFIRDKPNSALTCLFIMN